MKQILCFCAAIAAAYDHARFGVASSSSHGGAFEMDYIRWTTDGAFAPYVPPKGTIITIR